MSTVNKLLVGVAVGAILGVLYAPDKGSITRRKLSRTGDDIRDRFNDLKDSINDKIDNLRDDVDDMTYQEMVVLENDATVNPDAWKS